MVDVEGFEIGRGGKVVVYGQSAVDSSAFSTKGKDTTADKPKTTEELFR
jgi:hypothetical protein